MSTGKHNPNTTHTRYNNMLLSDLISRCVDWHIVNGREGKSCLF